MQITRIFSLGVRDLGVQVRPLLVRSLCHCLQVGHQVKSPRLGQFALRVLLL